MATTAKKTVKRQPAKRPLPSSRVAKKTTRRPTPRVREFELAITLGNLGKFAVSFKLSTPPKKPKSTKSKTKRAKAAKKPQKQLQTAISVALITIGVLGSVFFGLKVLGGSSVPPVAAASQTAAPKEPVNTTYSLPASNAVKLRIADIGVDAEVISVGKQADGAIEVPGAPAKVGQYTLGPTPGEVGPAVIVGHVDHITGPAVFWRLRELVPGQVIEVARQDGSVAKFKVDRVAEYPQDAFPTAEVYGNIDHAGLRLITCGGTFNMLTQHYSNNTVVYASLVR